MEQMADKLTMHQMFQSLIEGDDSIRPQLLHSQKMETIGTLAAGIAHDFNNILAVISGYTELSLIASQADSILRERLTQVSMACHRATDLTSQILAFSRQHVSEQRPISLTPVVKEVSRFIRATLPSTMTIRAQVEGEFVILADPCHIHQILMNLCTNAAQAMERTGGTLTIAVEHVTIPANQALLHRDFSKGAFVRVRIGDTGPGIPPDVLPRIFDPFFTTKIPGEGTGLGLAMVQDLVTRHDGVILVNTEQGKGTEVDVYFPLSQSEVNEAAGSSDEGYPQGRERILFVDDEPGLVQYAQEFLSQLGYRVAGFTNAVQALEAFTAAPQTFDLIVTDQTMPKLTGEGLASKVHRVRPDIPIIISTGLSHAMTTERKTEIGIQGWLLKPASPKHFATTLRRILDQHPPLVHTTTSPA